jgi:hypothetical protein
MKRLSRGLVVTTAALALLAARADRAQAQVVVSYYNAPAVSYYAPPIVSYYAPPVVSYYAPPVTTFYAAPAPVTAFYVAPAPVSVTTYRGILPWRRVTTVTYGAPAVRYYYSPPVVYTYP